VALRTNPLTYQDQPLLRLPYELLRKNFKAAQLALEKDSTAVKTQLKDVTAASLSNGSSPDEVLKNLDAMITRMRGLKRKLTACAEEERRLERHSLSRVKHLRDLFHMKSLDDVEYRSWSRTRLNRLLVDYLLRNGYKDSAAALATDTGIEELVDVDTFAQMSRICGKLRQGKVTDALAWCAENKKDLRRMGSSLEFDLRFQQYVELLKGRPSDQLQPAVEHFRKHIMPFKETHPLEVLQSGGILAFRQDGQSAGVYSELLSQNRWADIAHRFSQTHNQILALTKAPLLHVALSAGLSALKTPSCHSSHVASSATPSASASITNSVCPICSTELNELARNVPYAQHTKSHVDPDAVLLPNSRVYGKRKLEDYSRKAGVPEGMIKDLKTGEVFPAEKMKKVYIM
jgi:macrophage erythroblast attacher